MDAEFWLGIILGAFAGRYLPQAFELLTSSAKKTSSRRAVVDDDPTATNGAIVGFYAQTGNDGSLYEVEFGGERTKVPFLTHPDLIVPSGDMTRPDLEDLLVVVSRPERRSYVVLG